MTKWKPPYQALLALGILLTTAGIAFPFADVDRDGVQNRHDNCSLEPNGLQRNADDDRWGDACDLCPNVHNNAVTLVPAQEGSRTVPVQANQDEDGDGIGNACDNCWYIANSAQLDANNNGIGDACE